MPAEDAWAAQRTLRTLIGAGPLALAMVVQVSIQAPLPAMAAPLLRRDAAQIAVAFLYPMK